MAISIGKERMTLSKTIKMARLLNYQLTLHWWVGHNGWKTKRKIPSYPTASWYSWYAWTDWCWYQPHYCFTFTLFLRTTEGWLNWSTQKVRKRRNAALRSRQPYFSWFAESAPVLAAHREDQMRMSFEKPTSTRIIVCCSSPHTFAVGS